MCEFNNCFLRKDFPFRHSSWTPPWVIPVHVASNFTPNHWDIHFHQNTNWSDIQFESNGLRMMLCLCHLTTVPNNWAFFMILPLDSNIIIPPVFHWRTIYKKVIYWIFWGVKFRKKNHRDFWTKFFIDNIIGYFDQCSWWLTSLRVQNHKKKVLLSLSCSLSYWQIMYTIQPTCFYPYCDGRDSEINFIIHCTTFS